MSEKQSVASLPEQLASSLRSRIISGEYVAGSRLSGIRRLSTELHASQVTVMKSLELLEREGYVIRKPASGVYVSTEIPKVCPKRIAFVFPERSISREWLSPEGWAMGSELYRGLLLGGHSHGMQVFFESVLEPLDDLRLTRESARLSEYDAVVFAGHQLWSLQESLQRVMPVYEIGNAEHPRPLVHTVDYDRFRALEDLVSHVKERGYRSCGTLDFDPVPLQEMLYRSQSFRRLASASGLRVREVDEIYAPSQNKEELQGFLRSYFQRGDYPEFLFCNHAEYILDVYEVLLDLNLRPGRDVGLAGIAAGPVSCGLVPSYTYVRVPMAAMGEEIIQRVAAGSDEEVPQIRAELVVGKSTAGPR